MDHETVGARIFQVRQALGVDPRKPLSVRAFAAVLTEAAGARLGGDRRYDGSTISRWERGLVTPSLDDLAVIASIDPIQRGKAWLAWGEDDSARSWRLAPGGREIVTVDEYRQILLGGFRRTIEHMVSVSPPDLAEQMRAQMPDMMAGFRDELDQVKTLAGLQIYASRLTAFLRQAAEHAIARGAGRPAAHPYEPELPDESPEAIRDQVTRDTDPALTRAALDAVNAISRAEAERAAAPAPPAAPRRRRRSAGQG